MRVLYLSYDGLTDPLGQSQILPYLVGCAEAGHAITIVSFEKPERRALLGGKVAALCERHGMDWHPATFRSSPRYLVRAADQVLMRSRASRLARRGAFDLVHARSYPPAVAGLHLKRRYGLPLLFDMRGFWPDSRREGGRWPESSWHGRLLFGHWKQHERDLLGGSAHIIAMAQSAADALPTMPGYAGQPVSVVPCCADFDLFRPSEPEQRARDRDSLGLDPQALVLVYVGSLGTIYRLQDQLRLFAAVRGRRPGARMLFVGHHRQQTIIDAAASAGIALRPDEVRIVASEREDMSRWISVGDVGTCFYTPTFSSLNVSPTKLAEYLACGVPAIGNSHVGDVEALLQACDGGMCIPDFSDASIETAADAVLRLAGGDRQALRARAKPLLDLPRAVASYLQIYATCESKDAGAAA